MSKRIYLNWYRFDKDGLNGLKDQPRSGRPPDVPKGVMIKIKQELADSNTGWDFRQVMDIIYKKTGVRYHEVPSLDPLKMRTPCNGDFFTPIIVNRGGQTDARC